MSLANSSPSTTYSTTPDSATASTANIQPSGVSASYKTETMHLSTVHRSRYYRTTVEPRGISEPAGNSHMSSTEVTLVIISVIAVVLFGTWFIMKRRQQCRAKHSGQGSHFSRDKTQRWRDPESVTGTSLNTLSPDARSQSAEWDAPAVARPAGAFSPVESPYGQPGYWYDSRTDRNHPAMSNAGFEPAATTCRSV